MSYIFAITTSDSTSDPIEFGPRVRSPDLRAGAFSIPLQHIRVLGGCMGFRDRDAGKHHDKIINGTKPISRLARSLIRCDTDLYVGI